MKLSRRALFMVVFTIAVLSIAALAGCSSSSNAKYAIDGGEVSVDGKNLTVTLEGNPTTGYEWTADIAGSGIELGDQTYATSSSGGTTTGAGGNYKFAFTGKSAGDSTITFTYARSWESSDDDRTVIVHVTTNDSGNITHTDTVIDGKTCGESNA